MPYGLKNNEKVALSMKKELKLGNGETNSLHPTLTQLLHWKGEPMKMRLKPSLKKDSNGNKLPDWVDPNGKHHYVSRRWYASFEHKSTFYGNSLGTADELTAHDNLVILYNNVKNGKYRKGLTTLIKLLTPVDLKRYKPKEFDVEGKGIQKKWINDFFGEYTPNELNKGLIIKYMEQKWGRNEEGKLFAKERSFKADMAVLKSLCKSADKDYDFEALTDGLRYVSEFRDFLPPLTKVQIDMAWEAATKTKVRGEGESFKKAFWIMVYTGIEAMDIWELKPKHFKVIDGQEWLIKDRHKTQNNKHKNVIKVPVIPQLKKIIDSLPIPIDKSTKYFTNFDTENCNQAISRYFSKAGLEGYGSKYIRKYMGSLLTTLGYSQAFIGQVLAHAVDSKQTKKYMKVPDGSLAESFDKIAKLG